ncbi:MAG: quinol:cytochrome C oxidoreductase [bacterium]|nr:quinol:cytochrome C oxidoreductase [bacterium]
MAHGTRTIQAREMQLPPGSGWGRLPLIGLVLGAAGILASFALGRTNPEQFYHSWLVSFVFFLSIALGALFFVLVHFATKGGWGVVVRRLAENAAGTLPLFALLFIPVWMGISVLFEWSHADVVAADHLLQSKEPFLNQGFFTVRAAFYLVVWSVLALVFLGASRRQDVTGDHAITRRLIALSGPGIMIFAVTVSFASIDWIMSLDAHWYSTMFGVYYFAGSLVGAFALMSLLAAGLSRSGPLKHVISLEHFHDLGKLLFAFTVFWAYIAFSQYFLIWYANIPEETLWFLHRAEGGWKTLSIALGLGHFVVPFFFLMSRHIKRRTPLLVAGALWMLGMHLADLHWLIMPNLHAHDIHVGLLDVTTLVGVGGVFLAGLGWNLKRSALVPVRDPRLAESLSFQNF